MSMTNFKKIAIGILIGIGMFLLFGFTYNVGTGTVDVRIVTIGGHEYVVSTVTAHSMDGGASVSIIHHAGCSACRVK